MRVSVSVKFRGWPRRDIPSMKQWGVYVWILENLRFCAFQDQRVKFPSQNSIMSPPPPGVSLWREKGGFNNQHCCWLLKKLCWDSFNLQILGFSHLLCTKSVQNVCYWEKILIDFNLIVIEINYDVMWLQQVKTKDTHKFRMKTVRRIFFFFSKTYNAES